MASELVACYSKKVNSEKVNGVILIGPVDPNAA